MLKWYFSVSGCQVSMGTVWSKLEGAILPSWICPGKVRDFYWRVFKASQFNASYNSFRSEEEPRSDNCVQCPSGKYLLETSSYAPDENLMKPLWATRASEASQLCAQCPGKCCLGNSF